jgi:hypothetical protein
VPTESTVRVVRFEKTLGERKGGQESMTFGKGDNVVDNSTVLFTSAYENKI